MGHSWPLESAGHCDTALDTVGHLNIIGHCDADGQGMEHSWTSEYNVTKMDTTWDIVGG
jgi:hypothetical protein